MSKVIKGFVFSFICLFAFLPVAQATVAFPKGVNPYKGFEKAIAKLSKKEKAIALEKLYTFMEKHEMVGAPIVAQENEPIPDWLDSLLWETAYAMSTEFDTLATCETQRAKGRYPASCLFGGHLICTSNSPPKCTGQAKLKDTDYCGPREKDVVKCTGIYRDCNNSPTPGERGAPICADVGALKKELMGSKTATRQDRENGPRILGDCRRQVEAAGGAKTAATCVPKEEIVEAFKAIDAFCKDLKTRPKIPQKTKPSEPKDQYIQSFAGNDKDCDDILAYASSLKDIVDKATPPTPPGDKMGDEQACDGNDKSFETLCQGQDINKDCGDITYTPDKKAVNGKVNVSISQNGVEIAPPQEIKRGDVKKQGENPGRGMNWIHRACKRFWGWDDLGRVMGENKNTNDEGNPWKITDNKGVVLGCYNADTGRYEQGKDVNTFLDQMVKSPEQREIIKTAFVQCYDHYKQAFIDAHIDVDAELEKVRQSNRGITQDQLNALSEKRVKELEKKTKGVWTMVKVSDVTEKRMGLRVTGLERDKESQVKCLNGTSCVSNTFVCAKLDGDKSIKAVAEYANIYSTDMKGSRTGNSEYVESGTYKKENKRGNKTELEYKECPVSADVWAGEEKLPFLSLHTPTEVKGDGVFGAFKGRDSVVYAATERLCQEPGFVRERKNNKVIAKFAADKTTVEKLLVCDSENKDYDIWLELTNISADKKIQMSSAGDVKLLNLQATDVEPNLTDDHHLDLAFNRSTEPGACIWKWDQATEPTVLAFKRGAKVEGTSARKSRINN